METMEMLDKLEARIRAAEAERDAARAEAADAERNELEKRNQEWKETADNYAAHCGKACEQIEKLEAELAAVKAEAEVRTTMAAQAREALRRVMNGLPADDAVWAAYQNADSARAWLADRDAIHNSDLTAARAGEARAVEALKSVRGSIDDAMMAGAVTAMDCLQNARDSIDAALYANDSTPAIDWLAQQRREAVAEELDEIVGQYGGRATGCNPDLMLDRIKDRAAELRKGKGE